MSRINNIRIINLNYNNNNMRIDDETFHFGGKSTLINLRNGGGKSVLVQMMMAPLMNKRYRNIKDRTFESYFTTNTPTYILMEWLLDDNAGYVLTGMMVRKRQLSSDEDSKDKLEIINFVHEYKERNEYDIKSIPFVEIKGENRSLRNFISSKNMFESLKKNDKYKFNYYDMTTQGKRYFDKLKEYKIDNKEWEEIIRKINLKESGLSELFNSAKNENGLIKEWLIPAVESKLNKSEDRIKSYNELMYSYVKQYKNNKSKINNKHNIELFMELSKEIQENAEQYKEFIDNKEEIENNIANIRAFIESEIQVVNSKIEKIEVEEDVIDKSLEMLKYEKISRDIYKEEDFKKSKETELEEIKELCIEKQDFLGKLVKKKNVLQCAKLYLDYRNASEETQRLENELQSLSKTKDEKAPRIKDLGYSIKSIIEGEEKIQQQLATEYEHDKAALIKSEEESNGKKKEIDIQNKTLNQKLGAMEENIKRYSDLEGDFNKKYNESISRNIEGYYIEYDFVNFEENINKEIDSNNKKLKNISIEINNKEEILIKQRKDKEKNILEIENIKNELKYSKKTLDSMEEKINERKEVIKYIEFNESKLFNKEEIIEAFNRKINGLEAEEKKIYRNIEKSKNELEKLKSGKILELPNEVKGALNKNDINILYGMEWLKNNGLDESYNKELVKVNSFIPYSLIMDKRDIENLKKSDLGIFTNFPIPIIKREELEKSVNDSSLIEKDNISFYISFNYNLLDEEELKYLMEDIEARIEKLEEQYIKLNGEKALYIKKRGVIEYSELDYNEYLKLKDKIEKNTEIKEQLETEGKEISYKIVGLNKELTDLKLEIENIKSKKVKLKSKSEDFYILKAKYIEYRANKVNLTDTRSILEKNEKIYKDIEKEIIILRERLDRKKELIRETKNSLEKLGSEKIEYLDYLDGRLIEKDKEDLVSEYQALTKEISESEKSIKESLNRVRLRFIEAEEQLTGTADMYGLKSNDYSNEIYSLSKIKEVSDNIENSQNILSETKEKVIRIEADIAHIYKDLKKYYEKLLKDFDKEEPLDRNLVFDKDFKLEEAKLKREKKNLYDLKKIYIKNNDILNTNKNSLEQYKDLKVKEHKLIEVKLEELGEYKGKIERDLRNVKEKMDKKERCLLGVIVDISNNEYLKEEVLFKEPLNIMRKLVNDPNELLEHLNMLIESYNLQLEKLNTDIELIKEEEENLLISLLEYIKDIHENLGKIDENSNITINNKNRKMFEIEIVNFDENIELFNLKLKDYIESIRDRAVSILEENKNVEEYINNNIKTIKLYDEVVNVDSIKIKLYKVEENNQIKITWSEVSKNSGGEGFLSAFVVLSSLLSYTRKNESDIFSRNEGGKVLIMDNPFAQTNAVHLLKPLMDVAKKSNTQLICLSGLGGDSIYNRFDNIYVLNLIKSSLNNKSYLKGEHKKGDEETESLVSAKFNIEELQTKLF